MAHIGIKNGIKINLGDVPAAVLSDKDFLSQFDEIHPDAAELKEELRQKINGIADPKTREGIMSDVLSVMVVGLSQLTVAMSKAKTIDDIKAAAAPLAEIGAVIDAGVNSGAIKLPYTVKEGGAKAVLEKMVGLSNGVTAVLQASKAQA